ncbi:hypothetical protein GF325_07755, partial [Candidatus Bathyarchaeota archaeon]|nr:hypothetical protein [Candidatus Bathyarchaeota archaeon]
MPEPEKETLRKFMVFLSRSGIAKNLIRFLLFFPKVKRLFCQDSLHIHAVAQSHLDTCWLWSWDVTKRKIFTTFGNALRNIREYEGFKFSAPAPAHYEYMEREHPAMFRHMQEMVQQGRWELVGGMWVESDLIVPCGESLIRQRLFGQRYFLERFGRMPRVAWSPDVFGFPWSLPQIYKKSGADFFFTTKLTWNTKNEFPFPLFNWMAPDGSSVLAMNWHYGINKTGFIRMFPTKARLLRVHLPPSSRKFSYTKDVSPGGLEKLDCFSNDHVDEYLFCYGQGDGGNGPYESEIILIDAMARNNIGKHSTAGAYFSAIEKYASCLPIWNDECYLEVHRGCPTTHYDVKQLNRKCEELLISIEKMATMVALMGFPYPAGSFKKSWKKLLFNQFHDILPGSSIQHVYYGPASRYSIKDYREIIDAMERIKDDACSYLLEQVLKATRCTYLVFHPCQWQGAIPIGITMGNGKESRDMAFNAVMDGSDRLLPIQHYHDPLTGERKLEFMHEKVPGLTFHAVQLKVQDQPVVPQQEQIDWKIKTGGTEIFYENRHYLACISKESGIITRLVVKSTGKNLAGAGINILRTFTDAPTGNDAWNIDEEYRAKAIDIFKVSSASLLENGPVFASIIIDGRSDLSRYQLVYKLYHDLPWIQCDLLVDWQEEHVLMRVEHETSLKSDHVTTGIPLAWIDRPTVPGNSHQESMFEFHGQKWISMSDDSAGLTMINKARYGFDASESRFGMSLLRSPRYPTTDERYPEMEYPEHLMQFTDQRENHLTWCLVPHDGTWKDARAWVQGTIFNYSPVVWNANNAHYDEGEKWKANDSILPRILVT